MTRYSLHPESIRKLFDSVAPHYDFLNHLLSLRRDIYWRKVAVGQLQSLDGWILDVATGTGDVAIEIVRQDGKERKVFGVDFSPSMLRGASRKLLRRGVSERVSLGLGDALCLPFRENTFSGSIIAFGLRNIPDKMQALSEMVRVTRGRGKVIVLEFTLPEARVIRRLYPFYFQRALPRIGGWASGDKGAYAYLPRSVLQFPESETYVEMMKRAGLRRIVSRSLTWGITSLIAGEKGRG